METDESEEIEESSESSDSDADTENTNSHNSDEEQWVSAIEYCSFKSKADASVPRTIGVERLCRTIVDNIDENEETGNGWVFSSNQSRETLIVSFENRVFINKIIIYQSLNPGSIVKLEMLDHIRQEFRTMWEQNSTSISQSKVFEPFLRRYRLQSNTIRLTFDSTGKNQIGIRAIKLVGSETFNESFDRVSVLRAMEKLHADCIHQTNTDIQFRLDEKLIYAHRNILCCRSSYFRALLLSDFKEKSQKTPIVLTDVDHDTFSQILHYIYQASYDTAMPFDTAVKVMFYANKINFLTAKQGAIEHICCHLRSNHQDILSLYRLIKPLSPAFDILLEHIYDLISEHSYEIAKQNELNDLDKEYLIDLFCQIAVRHEKQKISNRPEIVNPIQNDTDSDVD